MSGAIADQFPNGGPDRYERMIKELQRQIDELRAAKTLDAATITATAGHGIRTADFNGTDFAHPGTTGNYFGGDGTVLNALYLRPGSVTNDALASPTSPQSVYAQTTNFGLTTTLTNKLTQTLTVPAGFTSVACTVTCRVFVYNPNTTGGYDSAGGDYLYGQANIAGFNGWALPLAVSGNNGSGTNISTFSAVLTGLTPGGSVLVQAAACTAYASIAANAGNTAELSGLATWYR